MAQLVRTMYLLGYVLAGQLTHSLRKLTMLSFLLLESVSEYKTAIMKRDIDRSADSAKGSENNRRSLSRDTRIQAAGFHNQHR